MGRSLKRSRKAMRSEFTQLVPSFVFRSFVCLLVCVFICVCACLCVRACACVCVGMLFVCLLACCPASLFVSVFVFVCVTSYASSLFHDSLPIFLTFLIWKSPQPGFARFNHYSLGYQIPKLLHCPVSTFAAVADAFPPLNGFSPYTSPAPHESRLTS